MRDEKQSAQKRNYFNLGGSRKVKGSLGEKAVMEKTSSLRGCVKIRGRADAGSPRERGAEDNLAYGMWWVLKARRRYLILWDKLLHWGTSSC